MSNEEQMRAEFEAFYNRHGKDPSCTFDPATNEYSVDGAWHHKQREWEIWQACSAQYDGLMEDNQAFQREIDALNQQVLELSEQVGVMRELLKFADICLANAEMDESERIRQQITEVLSSSEPDYVIEYMPTDALITHAKALQEERKILRAQLAAANKLLSEAREKAVPDGWQVVPKEPTEPMLRAFADRYKTGDFWRERMHGAVIAMLAAAPSPASLNAKEGGE